MQEDKTTNVEVQEDFEEENFEMEFAPDIPDDILEDAPEESCYKAPRKPKNHWKKPKVDNALKNINNEVYKRNRQAPLQIKIDDMAVYVNARLKKRGLGKGLVCVQEEFNRGIYHFSCEVVKIFAIEDPTEQLCLVNKLELICKYEIWPAIRILMTNKGLTPGEITELLRQHKGIKDIIKKWSLSLQSAISANQL